MTNSLPKITQHLVLRGVGGIVGAQHHEQIQKTPWLIENRPADIFEELCCHCCPSLLLSDTFLDEAASMYGDARVSAA